MPAPTSAHSRSLRRHHRTYCQRSPHRTFRHGGVLLARQERTDRLSDIAAEHRAIVPTRPTPHRSDAFRPHRNLWGDRQISISRELTKVHEETIRSTLAGFASRNHGEYVIVIAGRPHEQQTITEESIRNALGQHPEDKW